MQVELDPEDIRPTASLPKPPLIDRIMRPVLWANFVGWLTFAAIMKLGLVRS